MIKINLLAAEMIKKEERHELIILAYGVLAIAFATAASDYTAKFASLKRLESRVALSQKELSKYESIQKQVETLQATTRSLETKKNIINTLMQGRQTYVFFMEDILELLPYNLWFKSITTQLDSDNGIKVSMDAAAVDNYAIADFVSALSASPSFSGVELGAITTSAGAKSQISGFRLACSYRKKR